MNEVAAARLNQPPTGAAEYITRYLAWVKEERRICRLIGPANVPPEFETLEALVRMPVALDLGTRSIRNSGAHVRGYFRGVPADRTHPAEDAIRLDGLNSDCPQILHLPSFMAPSIHAVAKNLAWKLPAGSLTVREQLLFLGGVSDPPSEFVAAARSCSGMIQCLPPMISGEQRYLNLATVHPVISDVVVQLDALTEAARLELRPEDLVCQGTLLRKVQREVFSRGYAEGLRTVMSRYVPELYFSRRDQPHLTAPWILLRAADGSSSARLGYVRLDKNDGAADTLTSAISHSSGPHR